MPRSAAEAAALLIGAHRTGAPIDCLPPACRPVSDDEVYAIQDLVAASLGRIGGWKVGVSAAGDVPSCSPVFADRIHASGVRLNGGRFHDLALEIEFAFRVERDLPATGQPYGRDEIADAVVFVPLIEILGTRFRDKSAVTAAERLADQNANGGFVVGDPVPDWRRIDFRSVRVELRIDGTLVQSALDTHPTGDPLGLVVWQANHAASRGLPLRHGDIVTTGSLQGATPTDAGVEAVADWAGGDLGRVTLSL